MSSVCILGRQPSLGIAELESLYGADKLRLVGSQSALLEAEPSDIAFERLGGTVKLARLIDWLDTDDWTEIENYLEKTVAGHIENLPEGKLRIGLSAYGFSVPPAKINAAGLSLKKIVRAAGRSVRIVPNKQSELNTAQVLHNQLTGPTGWELLIIRHGRRTALAQTVKVQDIEAYAARDQKRPRRDARVGMLPPKLAQIILNLADAQAGNRVLDPFCGTGVILQEAALMGCAVYGTDLDERMVRYTRDNLNWLQDTHNVSFDWYLEAGDAAKHRWQEFDRVACETYLGRPFSAPPASHVLNEVMQDVDTIHRKFLRNLAGQTKPGTKLCIAVPAWRIGNAFKHLETLDNLGELGYTRTSFVHAGGDPLVYHREGQVVGRELVTLVRA